MLRVTGLVLSLLQLTHTSSLRLPYNSEAKHLNWSSRSITEIPEYIQDMKLLVSLDLSNNLLEEIKPDILEKNTRLEIINLASNPFLRVPKDGCFIINTAIKVLDASFNPDIDFNASSLKCLPSLYKLILIGNNRCERLRHTLHPNLLVSCRREIREYKDGTQRLLETEPVRDQELLPQLAPTTPSLRLPYNSEATYLDWSSHNITEIPEYIQDMKFVVSLDLSNNLLEEIKPDILEKNTRLEIINLTSNPHLRVSEDGCFISNIAIKIIDASFNPNIDFNASSLKCLPSLSNLILRGNNRCKRLRHTLLPNITVSCRREFREFKDGTQRPLETESVRDQDILPQLAPTSPSLRLPYNTEATYIDWSSYNITEIPEYIQDMKFVVSLDLSNNLLGKIKPDILENNTRLEIINLTSNPYLRVPEDECFIINTAIKTLDASFNPNIDFNALTLSCLPKLSKLILIGNSRCKQLLHMLHPNLTVSCKREFREFKDGYPVIGTQRTLETKPARDQDIETGTKAIEHESTTPRPAPGGATHTCGFSVIVFFSVFSAFVLS